MSLGKDIPATCQSDGTRIDTPPRTAENADGNGSFGSSVLQAGVAKESGRKTCSTLSKNGGMVDSDNLNNTSVVPDGGLGKMQGGSAGDASEEVQDTPTLCSLGPSGDAYRTSLSRDDRVSIRAELYGAVKLGQVMQVKSIVERCEVDLSGVDDHGKAAAHIAACHDHCHEVLKYLLESGASVGQRDKSGALPLHAAVTGRNSLGVRHLLQFGAEVDARDNDLSTPLFVASQAMFHEVIAELLAGGGNPSLISGERAQTPLHVLIYAHTPASMQVPHRQGKVNERTPIDAASLRSLMETARAMVKAGAPLTTKDKSGVTVLDAARECNHELLNHLLLLCDQTRGDTILHAVRLGDASVVKPVNIGLEQKILSESAVEARAVITDNGSSLLHLAAEGGNLELVLLLLTGDWLQREGALPLNIDARDSAGRTALLKASYYGHTDVTECLLESGASPAIQDMSGTGVGYTFAETVSADLRTSMCEALQRWGEQGREERQHADSFVSTKAPEGDVIYLSGVVPLVDNSRTKHLWGATENPPPPAPAPFGEGGVSEGSSGHKGRHSGQRNTPAELEMMAAPQQKMPAPTENPEDDSAGSTKNPRRGNHAVPGVGPAAAQERTKSVGTEAAGEEELDVVHVHVRNRMKSSSTYETDDEERDGRMISATSQQSTGSAMIFEEGSDAERNCREFSGGKVRIRKMGGKGRRNRRHYKGTYSEANVDGAAEISTPSEASKSAAGEKTAAKSRQQDESSASNVSLSASPRIRNWKLRPCAPSSQLSVTPGGGSSGVRGANSRGTESAAVAEKVTPEPPKSTPTGRIMKSLW